MCFTQAASVNGTDHRLLEETKPEPPQQDAATAPEHHFELRREVLWNLRIDHRTSVLCCAGMADSG